MRGTGDTGTFCARYALGEHPVSRLKTGEIGRIFKTQLPGNFAHCAVGKQQQASGFPQLAVEDQPFRRAVGEAATDIGQAGFGEMQFAGVFRHRPVLVVMSICQLVKALKQLQLTAHAA